MTRPHSVTTGIGLTRHRLSALRAEQSLPLNQVQVSQIQPANVVCSQVAAPGRPLPESRQIPERATLLA